MKKSKMNQNSRYLAMTVLEKVEKQQAFSNLLLNDVLNSKELTATDRAFLTELVYGVIQNKIKLDYMLEPFIGRQKKIDSWVRQLLRLSLYQMIILDRIPTHAAVDEAVQIAKFKGHKGISGFINGVLRAIDRKGVRDPQAIREWGLRMSVTYSYPEWIVSLLEEEVGREQTEELLQSLSSRAKVSVRVNTNRQSVEDVARQLAEEGFETVRSKVSDQVLICQNGLPVNSALFIEGVITVQDESSALVAEAMQLTPADQVLDACAAPGGKTAHIASYLSAEAGGKVTALDLHEKKVNKIIENAARLRVLDVVDTRAMDARQAGNVFEPQSFERVLVDAPCSGLGLMRRKPDIRYQKKLEDIVSLQKVQLDILDAVAPLVKKDGLLVYSTCTITRKENDEVIEQFLHTHPDYEKQEVHTSQALSKAESDGMLHLYPHYYQTDGFFIAALKRKED
ncbi:Ribosomal RNA small subunit methyltransferase B [Alkalibacterium sp. AK22]|uniref:16S rRNA (cytosine(967)-C(5))-methyltransferase RsmB n=1 Tax=Alkalibacterium sp. AK22 TaxID=1229520 RepID=UPI000449249F|nr:16S rRNA (cytosine(967)-C(5))-methyltransferase RsmB [Alkalibacterium sp. AK22]EXJ24228.1 Ribosomal RNA small subunit methyltransferase B [Alkalibacterium sp. AK22]